LDASQYCLLEKVRVVGVREEHLALVARKGVQQRIHRVGPVRLGYAHGYHPGLLLKLKSLALLGTHSPNEVVQQHRHHLTMEAAAQIAGSVGGDSMGKGGHWEENPPLGGVSSTRSATGKQSVTRSVERFCPVCFRPWAQRFLLATNHMVAGGEKMYSRSGKKAGAGRRSCPGGGCGGIGWAFGRGSWNCSSVSGAGAALSTTMKEHMKQATTGSGPALFVAPSALV
jgi:hypothetical protein